jgi:hypothetical protein
MRIDEFSTCLDERGRIVSTKDPEVQRMRADIKDSFPPGTIKLSSGILADFTILPKGQGEDPKNSPCRYMGKVMKTFLFHRDAGMICAPEVWDRVPRGDREIMDRETLKNATAGLLELIWADSPKRFIVERTPLRVKNRNKALIFRTQKRRTYRILDPLDARKYMGLQNKGGGTPLDEGHSRKAHWRTYRSARFCNMRGQTQRIKASWVGPQESKSKSGNTIYRLRLDL